MEEIHNEALIVLQARMGSTRLRGKVLADVVGATVLERCIRRLRSAAVGPVVVATTWRPEDDPIAEASRRLYASTVRGDVDDVLARYLQAAGPWKGPFVIRATADNPLVDPGACIRVVESLRKGADYVVERGLPIGAAVEGMTTVALRIAGRKAEAPDDREHVTPWLRRARHCFDVQEPAAPAGLARPDLRVTIDTPGDLDFVRRIVAEAGSHPLTPLAEYIRAADRLSAGSAATAGAGHRSDA
jgi:spore coat polysaccharide biosynthesis protein SpsF (cytidylyltransferase family)